MIIFPVVGCSGLGFCQPMLVVDVSNFAWLDCLALVVQPHHIRTVPSDFSSKW